MSNNNLRFGFSNSLRDSGHYCISPKSPVINSDGFVCSVPSVSFCGLLVRTNSTDRPSHIQPSNRVRCEKCALSWLERVSKASADQTPLIRANGTKVQLVKDKVIYDLRIAEGHPQGTFVIHARNTDDPKDTFKTSAFISEFDAWRSLYAIAVNRTVMVTESLFDVGSYING